MNKKTLCMLRVAVLLVAVFSLSGRSETVFQEEFENVGSINPISAVDWHVNYGEDAVSINENNTNFLAGPVVSDSSGGFLFYQFDEFANEPLLIWTEKESSFGKIGDSGSFGMIVSNISFSLWNQSSSVDFKVALKINGSWYVSQEEFNATGSWTVQNLDIHPASWNRLLFTADTILSEGGAVELPAKGTIFAIGLFDAEGGPTGYSGRVRIDNYSVKSVGFDSLQTSQQESNPSVEWQHFGPGMSGYDDMFWIHDTDPNVMFMSLDMGNSHGTWNRGERWNTIKPCDGTGNELAVVQYIEFSHQDPDFGLAMAQEGIYSTTNRGRSWDFVVDIDPSASYKHSVLTVDPSDDDIWYIGAGQHWLLKDTHFNKDGLIYTDDAHHSSGYILKSVDKGQSWTNITSIFPSDADFSKIIVDPRDSDVVYASCQYGIYSSTNGGFDWTLVPGNGLPHNMPRDMVSYYDSDTGAFLLYMVEVTHYTPNGSTISTSGGVYRSADGGVNWENLTGNLAINLNTLDFIPAYADRYYRALAFWLDISQASAESLYPDLPTAAFSQFMRIAVDPDDKNRIYLAHNYRHDYGFLPGNIWMTSNGGTNWIAAAREGLYWDNETDKTYWQSRGNPLGVNIEYSHVQKEHNDWDNTQCDPRFLMVNTLGDVYSCFAQQMMRSTDNGTTWHQVDDDETVPGSGRWVGRGDSNLPGETICVDTGIPGRYLFGSGEHGLWRNTRDGDLVYPGAIAVEQISGQSTDANDALSIGAIAVHPDDTNKIYTLQFRQTQRGRLRYSPNGGASWQTLSTPVVFPGTFDVIYQHSLLIDPDTPSNMYFCVPLSRVAYYTETQWKFNGPSGFTGHGIYKSTDEGRTWNMATNGIPSEKSVYQLAFDPDNPQIIYAALPQTHDLESGGLYKTVNGGSSWSSVSVPAGIESVNQVIINKTSGEMFIACGTFGNDSAVGGAWVSRDDGASWNLIFDMPNVRGITCSSVDTNVIAVNCGQDRGLGKINPGVYISLDNGETWEKINTNLGQPDRVQQLVADPYDSDILWCGLYGTGFWRINLFHLDHTPEITSFETIQDSEVRSDFPTVSYGSDYTLKLQADPDRYGYIQFNVSGLEGFVTDAKLWVCNHFIPVQGTLCAYTSSNGWSESNVTWNLKHDLGTLLSSRELALEKEWYPIDITSCIVSNGLYTIGLAVTNSPDGRIYSSEYPGKEPYLEITTVSTTSDYPSVVFEESFYNPGADVGIGTVNWHANYGENGTAFSETNTDLYAGPIVSGSDFIIYQLDSSFSGDPLLIWTEKDNFGSVDNMEEICVSFKNSHTDVDLKIALKIAGNWYVSQAVLNGTGYSFVEQSLEIQPAGWNALTFVSGSSLTEGGAVTLPQSGVVQAVGLFDTANTTGHRVRFDDYIVNAYASPDLNEFGARLLMDEVQYELFDISLSASISSGSPNGFVIQWVPSEGYVHDVYRSGSLTGSFDLLRRDIEFPQNSYTDTTFSVKERGFYKVERRPR